MNLFSLGGMEGVLVHEMHVAKYSYSSASLGSDSSPSAFSNLA